MSILIILTPESMLPQAMDVRSRSIVHIIHATFGRIEKKYWPQRKAMEIMKEHDDDQGGEGENKNENGKKRMRMRMRIRWSGMSDG